MLKTNNSPTRLSKLEKAAYDAEDGLQYMTARGMNRDISVQLDDLMNASHFKEMLLALETTLNEGLVKFTLKRPNMVDRRSSMWETSSFVIKSQIYGRDDDKDKVVKLLLSSQADQEGYASCIAIVGIGGIGKTTLAQLAYNDERVIQNFDVRMWIYVSDDFNVKKIMKTNIESVTNDECRFSDIELLQSQLWRLLHNKRYLLVLDDIWTSHHNDWDKLKPLFRGGVDGCKVIVTTRNTKTALMTDSPNSPFYLKGLEEEDCWALFKQQAFGRGEEEKYPHLLPIGKQIVRKCGGVPLAAKSLGSVMRFKRNQQWLFMQHTEIWKLDVCELDIIPALMLSYFYLPFHLRRCFAFCSIFPKGYEFNKHKLIHMWMAEGLLLENASKRPENVGDEYFTNLLWMSFFQEVHRCDGGGVIGYKMNDAIHDLAQYVAGNTTMILENGLQPKNLEKLRHSSVVYGYRAITIPRALYEAQHLRSLLFIGESGLINYFLLDTTSSSFVYLRMLDLNSCDVHRLPESLCDLICLRYLDLSYTPIFTLPYDRAVKILMMQQTTH